MKSMSACEGIGVGTPTCSMAERLRAIAQPERCAVYRAGGIAVSGFALSVLQICLRPDVLTCHCVRGYVWTCMGTVWGIL